MKRSLPLIIAAPALALAACAQETHYAPQSASATQAGFGYSSTKLAEDRYRVTFAGAEFTSRETVEDYRSTALPN